MTEFGKFCVVARSFANGALDRGNIRNLRTDVKMNELETMREAGVLQHLTRGHEIRGVETELGVFTAAR